MKNNQGISLITLIITIVVMLILIGVVGKNSIESIEESRNAVSSKEISDVNSYVLSLQGKIIAGDFNINLVDYPEIILNADLVYTLAYDKLTNIEINNILDVNNSTLSDNYKYYYFPASKRLFESDKFSQGGMTLQDIKGDYIINFYTGTVILLTEDNAQVTGLIKGLEEISAEVI